MNEFGLLWLIKSSILQMARSMQSLLTTMPSLVQILKEHWESNPAKLERLTKQLEDKEVELVDCAKEVERLSQREADLQASLKRA